MKTLKTSKIAVTISGAEFKKLKINKLRNKIIKTYRKQGDSSGSIRAINALAKQYYQSFKKSGYYTNKLQPLVTQSITDGGYQRFFLVGGGLVKISLHVMPQSTQIPMHAHPGMFALTIVERGVLNIKNNSWGCLKPSDAGEEFLTLNSNDVSSGLPTKNNLHQIQAESNVAVFFSIRINLKSRQTVLERIFSTKKIMRHGFLMASFLPLITLSSAIQGTEFKANDYPRQPVLNETGQANFKNAVQNRQYAEQLRLAKDYNSQVDAVRYYQKAALSGDAESQYWLGVMYLDGSGVTEDDDMALEWISNAAKQNYEPAEKLLAYLLATEFDMDC